MPNATVRTNARPLSQADGRQPEPDAYYRDAYLELEEKIRDLKCMASIASDLICELRIERKGDNRTIVEIMEGELDRLVFSVTMASRMADALDDAYHLTHAQPDREIANV